MEKILHLRYTKLETFKMTKKWVTGKLPKRPKGANKGTFGKVLVVAGSESYPGAAYLSCAACYRVGAGLVTLVTDETTKIIVSRKLPELTFLSLDEIFQKINDYGVLLLGPGLGKVDFLQKILNRNLPKTVVDADGLNNLSKIKFFWEKLKGEIILTPHPGEMSRLTGLTIDEIQSDRKKIAKDFAKKWGVVLVLKGAKTVVSSPDGKTLVVPFANPALATAGTGDVLAGCIAGFLAQGLKPYDASCVGVYIHGMAGELLKEKIGDVGGLASDLLPLLPKAIQRIRTLNLLN